MMDLNDGHPTLLSFFFLCMVAGLYRVKDSYCISATVVTYAVADRYLLKF